MSSDELPPPLESVLRAAFLADSSMIPTTPKEVASHDAAGLAPTTAKPAANPTLRFSWEQPADNILQFPSQPNPETLAYAARTKEAISPETRARLSQLLREATEQDPHAR